MLGYDKPLYLMAFDHRDSFDAHRQALAAGAPASASGASR